MCECKSIKNNVNVCESKTIYTHCNNFIVLYITHRQHSTSHLSLSLTLALAHICASGVSWLRPRPPSDCMDRSITVLAILGATILIPAISDLASWVNEVQCWGYSVLIIFRWGDEGREGKRKGKGVNWSQMGMEEKNGCGNPIQFSSI